MKLKIAWIGKTKEPAIQALTDDYVKRLNHYAEVEAAPVKDESALLRFYWTAQASSFVPKSWRSFCENIRNGTHCRCCSRSARRTGSRMKPARPLGWCSHYPK